MEQHRHLSDWIGGFFGGGVGIYHFLQIQPDYTVGKFLLGCTTALVFGGLGALGGHFMHKVIFLIKHYKDGKH